MLIYTVYAGLINRLKSMFLANKKYSDVVFCKQHLPEESQCQFSSTEGPSKLSAEDAGLLIRRLRV